MVAVKLDEDAFEAAQREATRRGVDVGDVVNDPVQRFVVGSDLRELLAEFRRQDAERVDELDEDSDRALASDELRTVRRL